MRCSNDCMDAVAWQSADRRFCRHPCWLTLLFLLLRSWGTLLLAQLVQALLYKPEGRGFDSLWCHWNLSLT